MYGYNTYLVNNFARNGKAEGVSHVTRDTIFGSLHCTKTKFFLYYIGDYMYFILYTMDPILVTLDKKL